MREKLTAGEVDAVGLVYSQLPTYGEKTWSDAARQAAADARRGGSHQSFTPSTPIRHQLSHHATTLTVAARNATRNAKTPDDHEEAASQHINAAEAHREAMAVNSSAAAHHQSRINEHERQGGKHMEEAERLRTGKEGKSFKAWSEEARAAALAARRGNARSWHAANTDKHKLSGEAHDATDKANKKPSRESHTAAADLHAYAAVAHNKAGNKQLAEDHKRLALAHQAEAKKPKPGKVDRSKVVNAGSDDSTRGHDKPLVGTQFKPKASKSSLPQTGDAVELKTRPGVRLLVVDSGVDARVGAWVACRETIGGIPGARQKRVVAKPGELKAWKDK